MIEIKHQRIHDVQRHGSGGQEHWRVYSEIVEDQKLDLHCHAFPVGTLAWRAAEYEIDPNDVDRLLEVVLHEPHMVGHDHTSPDHVYNTDPDRARQALYDRISEIKTRVSIQDPEGHLDRIRQEHRVDPADLESKRSHANHLRQHGQVPGPRIGVPTDG